MDQKVEADLRILTYLAGMIESEMPEARHFQPVQTVTEFGRSLHRGARPHARSAGPGSIRAELR